MKHIHTTIINICRWYFIFRKPFFKLYDKQKVVYYKANFVTGIITIHDDSYLFEMNLFSGIYSRYDKCSNNAYLFKYNSVSKNFKHI